MKMGDIKPTAINGSLKSPVLSIAYNINLKPKHTTHDKTVSVNIFFDYSAYINRIIQLLRLLLARHEKEHFQKGNC